MVTLYKRNAKGQPLYWTIKAVSDFYLEVRYGLVSKNERIETIKIGRDKDAAIKTYVNAKRKEGYKELKDLYDNSPEYIQGESLLHYLDTYLPKYNTHSDGKFIPMLCKTLEDNKPFEKHSYFGQWKINGERCIITAKKSDDLFQTVKLNYRSREGVDWTEKLSHMDELIIPRIKGNLLAMMVEEGVALDGELYIPGYGINEINSFIKNTDVVQHNQLQFWCYDICIENMSADNRQVVLFESASKSIPLIRSREEHCNQKEPFVLLPNTTVFDITEAIQKRDRYIDLGFEGLVIRDDKAEYQFGGKRNNAMLKFKRKEDGLFEVLAVKEDKRGLPIFTLKNDINNELFECTINLPHDKQRFHLQIKDSIIGKKALVEFRERSGIKQVPFHAKIIKINL